jgi:hypothetical protein
MRLAWPEKFTLAIFVAIAAVLLFLGGFGENPDPSEYCQSLRNSHPTWTSADSYCFVSAEQHWFAFAWIEGFLVLKIVLPIWIVLRLIDLFGGGIAIRRAAHKGRPPVDHLIDLAPGEWSSSEPEWRRLLRRR